MARVPVAQVVPQAALVEQAVRVPVGWAVQVALPVVLVEQAVRAPVERVALPVVLVEQAVQVPVVQVVVRAVAGVCFHLRFRHSL